MSPSGDSLRTSSVTRTSRGNTRRNHNGLLRAFFTRSMPLRIEYGPPVLFQSGPSSVRSKSSLKPCGPSPGSPCGVHAEAASAASSANSCAQRTRKIESGPHMLARRVRIVARNGIRERGGYQLHGVLGGAPSLVRAAVFVGVAAFDRLDVRAKIVDVWHQVV